jgi:nicotinamidase/pyrazinamidase
MQTGPHDLLAVVDVQNDFCAGGALAVPERDAVIAVIHCIAPRPEHIGLTQDWHPAGHVSFTSAHPGRTPFDVISVDGREQRLWPDHCVQGTHGAELHPALHLPQAELILRKGFRPAIDSYSALLENDHTTPTGLTGYCRERGLTRLFFCGLAFDYCVRFSALDTRKAGFDAVVIRDTCRAIDADRSVAALEAAFAQRGVIAIDSTHLE